MLQKIATRFDGKGCIESLIGGRSENQDSAGWADTPLGLLVVVCDGMGGAKGGKHASELAVNTIVADVSEVPPGSDPMVVIQNAVSHANAVIYEEGQKDEYKGMGTTLTALLIAEREAFAAHVGDSRIYQLRNGKKIFRTDDHSMVFDMVRAKVISEEQARLSDCSNVILKALGISQSVEPDISVIPYCSGDRFVLCSDGFWSAFEESALIKKLSWKGGMEESLEALANEIDLIGKNSGCNHDNLTAAVVDVGEKSTLPIWKVLRKVSLREMVLSILLLVSIIANCCFFSVSAELCRIREELEELYNELNVAQDGLTARKVGKILQITGNEELENNVEDTSDNE